MNTHCRVCNTVTKHEKISAGVYDCTACGNEKQIAIDSAFRQSEKTYEHGIWIGDQFVTEFWCPCCKATTQHNFNIHTSHCAECGRERKQS